MNKVFLTPIRSCCHQRFLLRNRKERELQGTTGEVDLPGTGLKRFRPLETASGRLAVGQTFWLDTVLWVVFGL